MTDTRSLSDDTSARGGEFAFQAVAQLPENTLAMLRDFLGRQSGVWRSYLIWFWPAGRPIERRLLLGIEIELGSESIEVQVGALLRAHPAEAEIDVLFFDPSDEATADLMNAVTAPFFDRRACV